MARPGAREPLAGQTFAAGDAGTRAADGATRHPERPILVACGAVGLLFAMLAVLERVGVDRNVLGSIAVALPLAAVAVLAIMGRTIDRLAFAVDGTRGGALANGLALGAEWTGVWLVPAVVLLSAPARGPVVLGAALGVALLCLVAAGTMRRMGALAAPAFLTRRTGTRLAGLALAPAALVALAGLAVFQLTLLRALLVPFVGGAADATLMALVVLACLTCLIGGQRSLTLVNAFLAFFLTLAMVVPALAVLAGIDGLTAALPLDRAFADALPTRGGSVLASVVILALVSLALPSFAMRIAPVRRGGVGAAGAWAMLAAYVTMTAAALAFARAAQVPGLAVTANGETSILSVLPALGWLGAVWAGFAMSLFALAATLGQDVRLPAIGRKRAFVAPAWLDQPGLVVMRFVFILAPFAAWALVTGADAPLPLDVATAGLAMRACLLASAGGLVAPLIAGLVWRHVTWPGILLGQAAALTLVVLLWGTLDPLALALAAAGANAAALTAGSIITPRRWRPSPSLVATLRDP